MAKKLFPRALSVGLSLALCAGMVLPSFAASFADLQNAIDGTVAADDADKTANGTKINDEHGGTYGYGWNAETEKWGIHAWTMKKPAATSSSMRM